MLPIFRIQRARWAFAALACAGVVLGCGSDDPSGNVLVVDAEYNPASVSTTNFPIHETEISVGQTFTVINAGQFEQFQIVLTQGAAGSEGVVRIDVRPVLPTGEPEPDDGGSIITPIDIDTTALPGAFIEEFTVFDIGDQPDREVIPGEELAIVVTYLSRSAGTPGQPIAVLMGRVGNEYVDGTGSTNSDNTGFTNIAADYFFRTFVLQD